jgi:predicted cytidylate kinase
MKLTLAGSPGSGKSTVRQLLADKYDLAIRSTGDFMRQMALEYGFQDITQFLTEFVTNHPEVDYKIDESQRKFGEENDDFVLDAHLGFYCVPDACKILFTVSEEVAAERIFSEHRATESAKNVEESVCINRQRYLTMRQNFQRLYGVDIADPGNFDLIIDTTQLTPEKILNKIDTHLFK